MKPSVIRLDSDWVTGPSASTHHSTLLLTTSASCGAPRACCEGDKLTCQWCVRTYKKTKIMQISICSTLTGPALLSTACVSPFQDFEIIKTSINVHAHTHAHLHLCASVTPAFAVVNPGSWQAAIFALIGSQGYNLKKNRIKILWLTTFFCSHSDGWLSIQQQQPSS